MNISESKAELILSAVREILLGDNTATGNTVGSIESYCANRIQREDLQSQIDFPKIDLSCEEGPEELELPTGLYFLSVKPRTAMDDNSAPQTVLDRMAARINTLLHNQPASLNSASVASGKDLRCRTIVKESVLRVPDTLDRSYTKVMRYRVRCDDEILTT